MVAWKRFVVFGCGLLIAFIAGCTISPTIPESRRYPSSRLLPPRSGLRLGGAQNDAEELPELGEKATLKDYLEYAALNNPGLEAAWRRWRAAMERMPQVTALPEPMLQYGYYIEKVETRVGPQEQRFTLSQMFPWFGKLRLKGEMAALAAEAKWEKYQAKKLKLFHRVKKAYARYYFLGQSIDITEENLELLKYLEEVAREAFRAGKAKHSSVVRAQVEMGKLEDRLATLRELRRPRAAALNAALGRPARSQIPVPDSLPEERMAAREEQLLQWLEDANPQLRGLRHRVEKAQKSVELARKQYYPDFTLGFTYIETGSAVMRTSESGKDPVIAMAGVSLPIWWQKYSAGVREAKSHVRAARRSLSDKYYNLQSDLKQALFGVEDARRKMRLYEKTLIPKAEESLKVTRTGFRTGEADFMDLLDAQRTLLDFQLTAEEARADHLSRLAKLEKLIGRAVPRAKREKGDRDVGH